MVDEAVLNMNADVQTTVTAQVANGAIAYVALMRKREVPGPSGSPYVAEIWHTTDRGHTWRMLPWRRTPLSFMSRAAFARWPPDWVNRISLQDSVLELEVWEDNFNSDYDPIWRATWHRTGWRVRFERMFRTEIDGGLLPPSLELDLPGITTAPVLGPYR